MANVVWHVKYGVKLYLDRENLGKDGWAGLWDEMYAQDRAAVGTPVSERGLFRCGGICMDKGIVAWLHLRVRYGKPEAVHEHAEDEARHHVPSPVSDEHKAYQERIVLTATNAGWPADTEVRTRTRTGRGIRTDTLVEGDGGRRIGWEIQLSTIGKEGPSSVRARAAKALEYGITPAWHTDRANYSQRNDTQWTRSDRLPAYVIAKSGDLRVVSGFRALEFWTCDHRALYPCPKGPRRCGAPHVTPKPRDVMFDDLVRKTAAGLIVPIEFKQGARIHRFWVTDQDRNRYAEEHGLPSQPTTDPKDFVGTGSAGAPTCRPSVTMLPPQNTILDWSDRSRNLLVPQPCRYCRKPAYLIDDLGKACHKVCAEGAIPN
ncbi:hypothetical protein [Streptomyces scabiei]|uniref:hypothetical protein n=1 Tax=Streptomyces scabiei TaxID=1930 RepID=UPI003F4CD977